MLLINQSGCGGKRCSYQEIGKLSDKCSSGAVYEQVQKNLDKFNQESGNRAEGKSTEDNRNLA